MTPDFAQNLRQALEESLGFALKPLERLDGKIVFNYKAIRVSDGFTFAVKCSPPERHGTFCRLLEHLEEFRGSKAVSRIFPDAISEFRGHDVVCLSWCVGERLFPDQLTDEQVRAFADEYVTLSEVFQRAKNVFGLLPAVEWRRELLVRCRGWRCRRLRRLLERELTEAAVDCRPELVKVTHGDLHHGNFLFEGGRVSGVFDLEDVCLGYPAEDIVRYFVCAAEHLRWYEQRRKCRILRLFGVCVARLPYSTDEWRTSLARLLLRKIYLKTRDRGAGFWQTVNLCFRARFYHALAAVADQQTRMLRPLNERFGNLRAEKMAVYEHRPEDIPCCETSDVSKLPAQPLVSVVMTTYNHGKYIREAVEGVLKQQTDFPYELVIGEDCSQDDTRKICFELQRCHSDRVRVLWSDRNVNGPEGGNENRIQAHCRGEFLAYCEGDDYWTDPLKLQKQVDLLRRNPSAGMCFGGTDYLQQDVGRIDHFDSTKIAYGDRLMSGREFAARLLLDFQGGLRGSCLHTSTTVVRRVALDAARRKFPEIYCLQMRCGDDLRIAGIAAVADVCFVKEPLSVWRRNNGTGVTQREGTRTRLDDLLCRIFFTARICDVTLEEAIDAYAGRIARMWLHLLETVSPDMRSRMLAVASSDPDLRQAFRAWPLRLALRASGRRGLCRALVQSVFAVSNHLRWVRARRRFGHKLNVR